MKLSCVRYMLLLIPRSIVCPLCEGPCLFLWWQHLAVCSVGSGVPVQSVRVPLQPFSLMLFLVWCLSIVIDRCTSSDRSPGPMLMWVHLGHSYVLSSYVFITSCVCVMHDVCIVLGSSLVFLTFLLYVDGKKKGLSYLFYHNIHLHYLITSSWARLHPHN